MNVPFGMSESEWNRFCDVQKCKYGNYCNNVLGLCSECKRENNARMLIVKDTEEGK